MSSQSKRHEWLNWASGQSKHQKSAWNCQPENNTCTKPSQGAGSLLRRSWLGESRKRVYCRGRQLSPWYTINKQPSKLWRADCNPLLEYEAKLAKLQNSCHHKQLSAWLLQEWAQGHLTGY